MLAQPVFLAVCVGKARTEREAAMVVIPLKLIFHLCFHGVWCLLPQFLGSPFQRQERAGQGAKKGYKHD